MKTKVMEVDITKERVARMKRSIENLADQEIRKTNFFDLLYDSLSKTKGEPRQIRRAKAFAYVLDYVKLEVLDHDLIGGSVLGMWQPDPSPPTYEEQVSNAEKAIQEMIRNPEKRKEPRAARFALMARDHYNANIKFSDMQKIIQEMQDKYADTQEIADHEIAHLLEDVFEYDYGKDVMDTIRELPWHCANHLHLDYEMIINTGYGALLSDAKRYEAAADDPKKKEFYQAVVISLQACIRYIKRYTDLYMQAAEKENDITRKEELLRIATALCKCAENKADSFFDALQLMWITHIIASTQLGNALSFARFDQYMYPFYKKSIDCGETTKEEVREFLACMMLKVNEPKMRTVQSMTLAGTTPEGEDAANALTKTVLEAARMVKLPYPNISVRYSLKKSPDWLFDEAYETIKMGFGMPMLINEEVWVKNFHALGHPIEKAREFYNMGCVEMLVAARNIWTGVPGGSIHFAQIVNEILEDCECEKLKIDSFDSLFSIVNERVCMQIQGCGGQTEKEAYSSHFGNAYDAFGSALMKNCLEKGLDMYQGGLDLPRHVALSGNGLGTAVDSLIAIKKLVFEQKRVTLPELSKVLKDNFKGHEELRLRCLHAGTFYCNDNDEVDQLAAKLFKTFTYAVYDLNKKSDDVRYISSFFSYTSSVSNGEIIGATANGRLCSEPISDGLGPTQGKDVEGPTKLFNSLLKLDYTHLNGALATNIKINPSIFNSKSGMIALKSLLYSYLMNGGPQVQVNFVRREDLLDAQKNPDKHRDMVVRIAGFCEYFINLDLRQQNEIIERSEHEVG